ncbi:MAG: TonB-dependent receptor, partial [Burkholderiales bacterium]|nr:TonB-dependent receptor [Burkholderiales bacterium]
TAGPWAFEFSYGDRLKNDPLGTYLSDPLTPGQYQRDRHLLGQLRWHDDRLDGALQLSARVFVGGENYGAPFTYAGDPTLQTATSAWHGTELQALYTGWAGHKLMAGVEYQVNSRQDQAFADTQAPALDVRIPVSGWRSGVYAQDEWSITPTLAATLGLRYDDNSTEHPALSPRVGLAWQADADTTWKALFGRAYRAPNVFESDYSYVSQAPNPDLRVESIDTLELVLDRRVGRELALRGSAYRWLLRDLITQGTDPASALTQYQNGPGTTAQGLELSARQGFASGASLRGSLSVQSARRSDGTALANSPRWLAKLNLEGPLPGAALKASAELQYTSARLTLDGSSLPGAWLANAGLLADKWVEGLELSLYLDNVFGSRAAQPASPNNWQNAIAQDGRSLRAKLVYRF